MPLLTIALVNSSSSSILSNHVVRPNSSESVNRSSPPDVQTNWLSRFLHIKPASKTLCFQVTRGKVRGDLVRLLRDWQRFGVRDVTFDRNDNTINARVDKTNRKSLLCSIFLFSAWGLEDFSFDVEILKVDSLSRSNRAATIYLLA